MDHKLAIVIVPKSSRDPVRTSEALLKPFRDMTTDRNQERSAPKFRFMRVGGWFDGLVHGEVGRERWSAVLSMLLDGATTNAAKPFPGLGPEARADIENRIEAANTLPVDEVWPLAPCTVIVTPEGEWFAHPDPDGLDESGSARRSSEPARDNEAWEKVKTNLLCKYSGSTAVAWDLSWHFNKAPVSTTEPQNSAPHRNRGFTRKRASATAEWATRIAAARISNARRKGLSSVVSPSSDGLAEAPAFSPELTGLQPPRTAGAGLELLKSGWQDAKKAADSLFADFRNIEAARERTAQARKLYLAALRGATA